MRKEQNPLGKKSFLCAGSFTLLIRIRFAFHSNYWMSLPVGSRFPAVSVSIPEFNLGKLGKSIKSQSEVVEYLQLKLVL